MKLSKVILPCILTVTFAICGIFFDPPNAASAATKDGKIIMVSLGDSYSSGEGIEPFYGQDKTLSNKVKDMDWLAHRSKMSWPGQLRIPGVSGTMSENKDINWFFAASSGAVTENLTLNQKKRYNKDGKIGTEELPRQLIVFEKLEPGSVDYVTITIGGNDVGFTSILTNALILSENKFEKNLEKLWDDFFAGNGTREKIKNTYRMIAQKAGSQALIIVAGYPKLLNPEGFGTIYEIEISSGKAQLINKAAGIFNDELEKIVKECREEGLNIIFVDVQEEFAGHEAYTEEPYINPIFDQSMPEDLNDYTIISSYSIHPNYEGAKAYARAVQKAIDSYCSDRSVVYRKQWAEKERAIRQAGAKDFFGMHFKRKIPGLTTTCFWEKELSSVSLERS